MGYSNRGHTLRWRPQRFCSILASTSRHQEQLLLNQF